MAGYEGEREQCCERNPIHIEDIRRSGREFN
jgi:hypothetical protein